MGKARAKFDGSKELILDIAFAPDGRALAWPLNEEMKFVVWDIAGGKPKHVIYCQGLTLTMNRLAFSPDGKILAVTASAHLVNLFNSGIGKPICDSVWRR